jgi:hypothetical protein
MNYLLTLYLIFVLIILILLFFIYEILSYQNKIKNMILNYINVYKSEKDMKSLICDSNKDCNNRQVCQMDIDNQKRCFSKNNMIKRTCTNLVIPSYWLNPKTIPNKNIRNNRHSK